MFQTTDQLKRAIHLSQYPPKRIVSLVPSQTELLHDLGLEDEVIGITKFCVHPRIWFNNKEKIGGTKKVNIGKLISLHPDLIIANKEENVKEQIKELEKVAPVWISDVNNYEEALQMIRQIGALVCKQEKANEIIIKIETAFSKLQPSHFKPQACYLIWHNPYMSVGGDTFVGDMLRKCGFKNVFENEKRYPETTLEELMARGTQIILLSSEPFPFKEKHALKISKQLTKAKILFADGEMFSWYGSRMIHAAEYFSELLTHIYSPEENKNLWV